MCIYGHDSPVYKTGACKQCARERANAWYSNNKPRAKEIRAAQYQRDKDAAKANAAKWNAENKGRRREICKASYERNKAKLKAKRDANKEALRLKRKARHEANKEIINAKNRAYKKANKSIVNACNASRRAVARGAVGRFNWPLVEKLLQDQGNLCAACKAPLETYHVDHILPVTLGGDNSSDNLQILCPPCNLSKGALHPDVWRERRA